jgi:hypothetical protein
MEPSGWPSPRLQHPVVSLSPSPLPEHWLNSLESELVSVQQSTLFEVGLPVGGSNTQNHGKLELLSVIYVVLTVYHLAINDSDDVQRSNTQSLQSLQAPAAGGGSHFDPSVSFPNSERQPDFDSDFDSALARLQAGGSESGSSLQPQLPAIGSDFDHEAPLTQSQLRPDSPQRLNFHHVVSFPVQSQLQTLIDDDHLEFQESQGPLVFQPSPLPGPQSQLQEYNATHRQAGSQDLDSQQAGSEQAANHLSHSNHSKCCVSVMFCCSCSQFRARSRPAQLKCTVISTDGY